MVELVASVLILLSVLTGAVLWSRKVDHRADAREGNEV